MRLRGVAGDGPGQRRLNGPQTTGRDYRNLSAPDFGIREDLDLAIAVRDGTTLLADAYRPDTGQPVPALIAASCYPRQLQNSGAPMGFVEAGASDFWAPRGYAHVILNVRGTGGSGGTWTCLDATERDDLHDVVEWVAAQPWCDGNVGMIGISYFAMTQLAAAVTRPPHLKAIFPGGRHLGHEGRGLAPRAAELGVHDRLVRRRRHHGQAAGTAAPRSRRLGGRRAAALGAGGRASRTSTERRPSRPWAISCAGTTMPNRSVACGSRRSARPGRTRSGSPAT